MSAAAVLLRGVPIFASERTLTELALAREHGVTVLRDKVKASIGGWDVLPFTVKHDAPGTLGFLIRAPDGDQILFATDTGYIPVTAEGCTHLAIECNYSEEALENSDHPERAARAYQNHMGIERVLAMLESNDLSAVREIWLLHLSAEHGDADGFVAQVQGHTGIPCYIAGGRKGDA